MKIWVASNTDADNDIDSGGGWLRHTDDNTDTNNNAVAVNIVKKSFKILSSKHHHQNYSV